MGAARAAPRSSGAGADRTCGVPTWDCAVTRNRIGRVGILFRDESRGRDFWPNRNRVEANRVVNSGGAEGVAIDVRGRTRDVRLVGNVLRETRGPSRRTGIRIAAGAGPVELAENRIEGFYEAVADHRTKV